jgi:hypothetical protein
LLSRQLHREEKKMSQKDGEDDTDEMDEKANNDVVLSREEFDLESVFS